VLENKLYASLVGALNDYVPAIQADAKVLARLDCLLALTVCARENRYCRPVVDDSLEISITAGRHPVIERELPPGTPYIANSLTLDNACEQVMMITGPNMSGKSALLRSTALNVLMAQIGSFVAADAAHIGVVDKIFTRVGASDNISLGESTFMVEMNEAASILNNLSERSLILFDELGRGTSTYDGISIAWAIVEHINASPLRPKTLFATHYHELNDMEALYPGVVNYSVAVKEIDGKVVFLRKLQRGGSEHSFGIHAAPRCCASLRKPTAAMAPSTPPPRQGRSLWRPPQSPRPRNHPLWQRAAGSTRVRKPRPTVCSSPSSSSTTRCWNRYATNCSASTSTTCRRSRLSTNSQPCAKYYKADDQTPYTRLRLGNPNTAPSPRLPGAGGKLPAADD